jgi:hypothetical protein
MDEMSGKLPPPVIECNSIILHRVYRLNVSSIWMRIRCCTKAIIFDCPELRVLKNICLPLKIEFSGYAKSVSFVSELKPRK